MALLPSQSGWLIFKEYDISSITTTGQDELPLLLHLGVKK